MTEPEFRLTWTSSGPDALRGSLIAENIGHRAFRFTGKPTLIMVDVNGTAMPAHHAATLEGQIPPYVALQPRQTATASVSLSWAAETVTGEVVIVEWPGGQSKVETSGVRVYASRRHSDSAMMTSSSWFVVDALA